MDREEAMRNAAERFLVSQSFIRHRRDLAELGAVVAERRDIASRVRQMHLMGSSCKVMENEACMMCEYIEKLAAGEGAEK